MLIRLLAQSQILPTKKQIRLNLSTIELSTINFRFQLQQLARQMNQCLYTLSLSIGQQYLGLIWMVFSQFFAQALCLSTFALILAVSEKQVTTGCPTSKFDE